MKFQIQSVELDNRVIALSIPTWNKENVFTMLVGRNAVGKTRTLGKIANHYLFRSDSGEIRETQHSASAPSSVIAVSNSRFDRFPDPAHLQRSKIKSRIEYHYLGLAGFRSGPSTILSKGCEAILGQEESGYPKLKNISRILEYAGFLPYLNVEFRRPFSSDFSRERSIDDAFHQYGLALENDGLADRYENLGWESRFSGALEYLNQRVKGAQGLSFRIDLRDTEFSDKDFNQFRQHASILLKSGLLRVGKLSLYDVRTKDKVPFHHASSGQQCMLLMFFGIAGVISNDALICIDEPEISLHPRWQAEFIGILQEAFSFYTGCHFIIATHSPQIISGLVSENGFIVDLQEGNLIHASKYARRSADFQLTEVFHEPGFRNEYLVRSLLVLLSKISKEGALSDEDREKVRHFAEIKHRLKDGDPVLHLLSQIDLLAG